MCFIFVSNYDKNMKLMISPDWLREDKAKATDGHTPLSHMVVNRLWFVRTFNEFSNTICNYRLVPPLRISELPLVISHVYRKQYIYLLNFPIKVILKRITDESFIVKVIYIFASIYKWNLILFYLSRSTNQRLRILIMYYNDKYPFVFSLFR